MRYLTSIRWILYLWSSSDFPHRRKRASCPSVLHPVSPWHPTSTAATLRACTPDQRSWPPGFSECGLGGRHFRNHFLLAIPERKHLRGDIHWGSVHFLSSHWLLVEPKLKTTPDFKVFVAFGTPLTTNLNLTKFRLFKIGKLYYLHNFKYKRSQLIFGFFCFWQS